MTAKSRTILFSFLLILFLLAAPGSVFYLLGYRIDFKTKRVTQTGAFYFKVWPKGAQIYLTPLDNNQKGQGKTLIKKTDFFFGASYVENLLPRKYEAEIKKEGFHPWKKILEIKEKQVLDAKNIVLIPENPQLNILTKNAQGFFLSPDEKNIILVETDEKGWSLKLLELEKNVKSHLIEEKDFANGKISLSGLKFSPDQERVLLKIRSEEGLKYFLLELKQNLRPLFSLDFLGKDIEDIFFNPENPQKLFLLKDRGLFEGDLIQKTISSKILEGVISFEISNRDIYYLSDSGNNSGSLFKASFSFSESPKGAKVKDEDLSSSRSPKNRLNNNPFLLKEDGIYKISVFSGKIFIQNDDKVFLFNSDNDSLEVFSERKQELKSSPDFKKVVYFNGYEIWVFFLKEDFGQPYKMAGERQFIVRFSEKVGNVFWLTSHYLIFNAGNKIKIAEIDDRDKIIILDLIELEAPKILWNKTYKKLFILSNNTFYALEISVP